MQRQHQAAISHIKKEHLAEQRAEAQKLNAQKNQLLEEIHQTHQESLTENQAQLQSQRERAEKVGRQNLDRQRDHFLQRYDSNQKIYEQSLRQQELTLEKDKLHKKLQFVRAFDQYDSRSRDPFYAVNWIRAELLEKPDRFEVYAALPEHEVENVRVRVTPEKITLSGKRSVEEKLQSESGSIETNSFQSFRHDIPLGVPVDEKSFEQSYENGVLKVSVPKKVHTPRIS